MENKAVFFKKNIFSWLNRRVLWICVRKLWVVPGVGKLLSNVISLPFFKAPTGISRILWTPKCTICKKCPFLGRVEISPLCGNSLNCDLVWSLRGTFIAKLSEKSWWNLHDSLREKSGLVMPKTCSTRNSWTSLAIWNINEYECDLTFSPFKMYKRTMFETVFHYFTVYDYDFICFKVLVDTVQ